jgi:hypothetical protein
MDSTTGPAIPVCECQITNMSGRPVGWYPRASSTHSPAPRCSTVMDTAAFDTRSGWRSMNPRVCGRAGPAKWPETALNTSARFNRRPVGSREKYRASQTSPMPPFSSKAFIPSVCVLTIITSSVLPSPGRIPTSWGVLERVVDAVSVRRAFGRPWA